MKLLTLIFFLTIFITPRYIYFESFLRQCFCVYIFYKNDSKHTWLGPVMMWIFSFHTNKTFMSFESSFYFLKIIWLVYFLFEIEQYKNTSGNLGLWIVYVPFEMLIFAPITKEIHNKSLNTSKILHIFSYTIKHFVDTWLQNI